VEIRWPGDLFLTAQKESASTLDVRVAGSTVLVATGQLFLPRCTCFQQKFNFASDSGCSR
jgi:hypothetical protein